MTPSSKRKTGDHYFVPCGGFPKCVDCGCDEDDAYVGGEKCNFIANVDSDDKLTESQIEQIIEQLNGGNLKVTLFGRSGCYESLGDDEVADKLRKIK